MKANGIAIGRTADIACHPTPLVMGCASQLGGCYKPSEVVGVLIAEDHPLYRESLARTVGAHPKLELVGCVDDGRKALQEARRGDADVMVLDLSLPYLDGLQVLRGLRSSGNGIPVVVLSGATEPETVHRALSAGADGYILKDEGPREICEKVLEVAAGRTVLSASLQEGLLRQIAFEAAKPQRILSGREREVLQLVADGLTNREIAERLVLSLGSIKTYVHRICRKLAVADRTAAATRAVRDGLL